jgi:hypothetical protein
MGDWDDWRMQVDAVDRLPPGDSRLHHSYAQMKAWGIDSKVIVGRQMAKGLDNP